MRFRLFLLTLVTVFLVTVLAIPWFISLSKLELDDSRPVFSVFVPGDQAPGEDLRSVLGQRSDVEELIPLEHLTVSTTDGSLELQAQPFRPRVVSISTESKSIMHEHAAVLLPRQVNGENLSRLDGQSIELTVAVQDDADPGSRQGSVTAKVAGVFDQGWSTLPPDTALVSAELLNQFPGGDSGSHAAWYLTLAPDADPERVLSALQGAGYDAYEELAPVRMSLLYRSLPWLGFAAAFVYAIVLAQQTKRVATSGVLTLLSSRARFIGTCLAQSLVGSLLGVALGLFLGWIVSELTFLRELTIEPEVWARSGVVITGVIVGTLIVVTIMAAGLWRAAQQSNSLEHFKELFA